MHPCILFVVLMVPDATACSVGFVWVCGFACLFRWCMVLFGCAVNAGVCMVVHSLWTET